MYASMNIWCLLLCPVIFTLLFWWPKRHGEVIESSRVGVLRRYFALMIDLSVAGLIVIPVPTMFMLFMEYLATGVWQWSFEREFFRGTDVISMIILLISMIGLPYYLKWHFKHQKQTIGQHLLGFKLLPAGENPSMIIRMFMGLIILSWWPIWPWTLFPRRQDHMWDTASNIKARLVRPMNITHKLS